MFAVPGWTLATGPAEQIDSSATKKKTKRGKTKKDFATGSNSVDVTPEVAAKIKERERVSRVAAEQAADKEKKEIEKATGTGDTTTVVTADNVEALWRKVIVGEAEGKEGGKKRKRGSSGGKKKAAEKGDVKTGESKVVVVEKKEDDAEDQGPPRKKTLKEKRREKKAASAGLDALSAGTPAATAAAAAPVRKPAPTFPAAVDTSKLTPLQQKMRAKLTSARFRHINETLYTTPSNSSLELFATQPEMYTEYHLGFRQQVSVWPSNPVDTFIHTLRDRSKIKFQKGYSRALNSTAVQPLPRDRDTGICTLADLGCGDAKIAATFNHGKGLKEKIKVLSFDLQASTPDVTIADVANLPLPKESVDVVIFCLALMGTNFLQFVDEAHRILKWRGELWVAEIKSRFNRKASAADGNSNAVGRKKGTEDAEDGDEPEMEGGEKRGVPKVYMNFVDALKKRGFTLKGAVDGQNKMFVRMEFVKQPPEAGGKEDEEMEGRAAMGRRMPKKPKFIEEDLKEDMIMKPCVYKLR